MSSFEYDSGLALLLHLEKYLVVQDMRQRAELFPKLAPTTFLLNLESLAVQLCFRLHGVISSVSCNFYFSLGIEYTLAVGDLASTCYMFTNSHRLIVLERMVFTRRICCSFLDSKFEMNFVQRSEVQLARFTSESLGFRCPHWKHSCLS